MKRRSVIIHNSVKLVVLFTLLLSLVAPSSIVFADDTTPPPDPPQEEVVVTEESQEGGLETGASEAGEVIEPSEELPSVTEELQAEAASQTLETSETGEEVSEAASDESTEPIGEVMAELPEDVSLVVMDNSGDTVALATTEAVEILTDPDPFLFSGGVKKSFTAADCNPDLAGAQPCPTPIQSAIDYGKTHTLDDRTIYIEKGIYTEATVTIADFTDALTLIGVLNSNGDPIINPTDRPTINGRILIQDGNDGGPTGNTANITLANLIINDSNSSGGDNPAIFASGNTATLTLVNLDLNAPASGNSGLIISNHSGNVVLTNVDASGTNNQGAYIDNTAGNNTVGVTVTGSVFNNNSSSGLYIRSDGTITLTNVTAGGTTTGTGNGNRGAELDNRSGTGNVTVTGSTFNYNNSNGLRITSRGLITLVNVIANYNGGDGAQLDNNEGTSTSNIDVVKSIFNSNNSDGLVIDSNGSVTLSNVTAQANRGDGVRLNFPGSGTHSVTICGGSFSGQSGSGDFNVEVINGSNRYTNLSSRTNWNPSTGWGSVDCNGLYPDPDGDQVPNQWDTDDDNDGVLDVNDAFPLDSSEWIDTDGDGTGNNADNDDDNDGVDDPTEVANGTDPLDPDTDNDDVNDGSDAFPLDSSEWVDTDGDGTGNNADTDGDNDGVDDVTEGANGTDPLDPDTDNDGVNDNTDAFPLDPTESVDTDGDGTGNNADTDDDNDGVLDGDDAFPLDPGESVDTDHDGTGNNADTDDDNDGVLDVDDAFPLDPTETVDTDGDGIGNNADPDDDGDGVLDINDDFPLDPNETGDIDGDGLGNSADPDDDNDGVLDGNDAFPTDPTESTDTDGDGIGNNADTDDDNDGVLDVNDDLPLNPGESVDTDGDGIGNNADTDDDNDTVLDRNDLCPVVVGEASNDGCRVGPDAVTTGGAGAEGQIPVTGGQLTELSCTASPSVLTLAGFEVTYDNLCGYFTVLGEVTKGGLPGSLQQDDSLLGGLSIALLHKDEPVGAVPAGADITLSFEIPADMADDAFAVLFWDFTANGDAGDWVEQDASIVDGKVVVSVGSTGNFVVVNKTAAAAENDFFSLVADWFEGLFQSLGIH